MSHVILAETTASVAELKKNPMGTGAWGEGFPMAGVGLAVEHGCLIVNPNPRPRYTLDELLAQCDASAEISAEDSEWIEALAVGSELL